MRCVYLIFCTLATVGCAAAILERKELQSIDSPKGDFKVVVESWDAGATASTAYHVFLTETGLFSNESVEVCIADKVPSQYDVSVGWTSENQVSLSFTEARIFKKKTRVVLGGRPVEISFKVAKPIELE